MVKKKHKKHAHPHIVLSQKAQSKLAKQKKQQKITRWVSMGIVGAVTLVIGIGVIVSWLVPVYLPLQKTVITVNGVDYNAAYVSKMVNFYTGGESTYAYLYIDMVLDQIEQNQLMKEEAAEMGISVSDKEVKERIKEAELDDNEVTRDIVSSSLLYQKLNEEHFENIVPASGEQRRSLVMLLESSEQAETVKSRLEAGESFADITEELSLDETTIENEGDMGFNPPGFLDELLKADGLDEKVDSASAGDIGYFFDEAKSKDLGYWIVKVTDRQQIEDESQVQVFGILLPTIEKAEEARQRLLDGEDFAAVVEEMSQDTASKSEDGDLGLLNSDDDDDLPFADYIFDEETEIDALSPPIKSEGVSTTGAYWLYKVAAVEEDREYSDDNRAKLLDRAFSDWLDELAENPDNNIERIELTDELKDLIAEQSVN